MQKKTGKEKIQIVNDMSLNKNKILELIIDVTEFEIEKLKGKHPRCKPPGFKYLLYKRKKVYSDKKKKERNINHSR
jgi:hypothetical protein